MNPRRYLGKIFNEGVWTEHEEWIASGDYDDIAAELAGYVNAFYEIAKLLDLPAMPISPKEAFETVMLPKLRALLTTSETSSKSCNCGWPRTTDGEHGDNCPAKTGDKHD